MAAHESLRGLLDRTIVDLNGERSGRVTDVLVDAREGRVEYARIALDERVSGSLRYVMVPWSALGKDREDGEGWFVNVRREALRRLARFETRRTGLGRGRGGRPVRD